MSTEQVIESTDQLNVTLGEKNIARSIKPALMLLLGPHSQFTHIHPTKHHDTTNHSKSNYAECVFRQKDHSS